MGTQTGWVLVAWLFGILTHIFFFPDMHFTAWLMILFNNFFMQISYITPETEACAQVTGFLSEYSNLCATESMFLL